MTVKGWSPMETVWLELTPYWLNLIDSLVSYLCKQLKDSKSEQVEIDSDFVAFGMGRSGKFKIKISCPDFYKKLSVINGREWASFICHLRNRFPDWREVDAEILKSKKSVVVSLTA